MALLRLKKIAYRAEIVVINLLASLVRFYQFFISPLLGNRCRFYPSCSKYFCDALTVHGLLKGFLLGTKRLCKCNPFFAGGFDPVAK